MLASRIPPMRASPIILDHVAMSNSMLSNTARRVSNDVKRSVPCAGTVPGSAPSSL